MLGERFIHYRQHLLHYVKTGNGKHPLLVFHGFGQDHTLYIPLLRSLGSRYTLFIVDLFFHGKSEWGDGEKPLSKKTWQNILQALLHEEGISSCAILAYSLGGKFALATAEAFPDKVTDLFLIAPDGIKPSLWYKIATRSRMFRVLFKSMIQRHDRFQWFARKLHERNVVNKGLIRFADYQMGTEEKRKRVYYSWMVFRRLVFDLRHIGALINRHGIRLLVIVGRHDQVIPPASMQRLLRHVRDYQYEVLDAGHTGLVRESLPYIAKAAR